MSCNGWKRVKLEDVINFNPKESIKKGKVVKKISMDKLETFTRKISGYEECAFTSGTKFRNGDTLLARITPCLENGKTAQVDILEEDEVAYGSTEFIVLREKEGVTLNNYIYYLAISPQFRQIAIKSMNGSSGRQRVQKDILDKTEMYLPCIEEQKKISDVLSSLDTKIELNNEMNKTLEEMAQALFKRWFVDFEYPDEEGKPYKSSGGEMVESEMGMIPKGWKVKLISELIEVKDGTHASPKTKEEGYPLITSKHISGDKIDFNSANLISKEDYDEVNKRSKVDTGDILISMIGTVGLIHLIQEKDIKFAIKNVGLFKASQKEYISEYLYLFLKSNIMKNYIESRLAGTTQKYISLGELRRIKFILPDEETINKFNSIVKKIFNKKRKNIEQIDTLTELRDSLLPKLMSGEIRSNSIETNL